MHEICIPKEEEEEEEAKELGEGKEKAKEEGKVKGTKYPSGYTNLKKLFKESEAICFDNLGSFSQLSCFSNFSQDLFSKLMTMAYYKDLDGLYFKFEASSILVKHDGATLLEVAVPISQLHRVGCPFDDKVTGPIAALIYDLCGSKRYKEVSILLEKAKITPKWWSTLQDILDDPIFWSPEKKISALIAAQIYLSYRKTDIDHGITDRTRNLDPDHFRTALDKNDFYRKDYTIDQDYNIKSADDDNMDWSKVFMQEKQCFALTYKKGKVFDRASHSMVTFNRNTVGHFGNKNMDVLSEILKIVTLGALVIELDRIFALSLMICHALRLLKTEEKNI